MRYADAAATCDHGSHSHSATGRSQMKSGIFFSALAAAFGIVLMLSAFETRLPGVPVAPAMAKQTHGFLIDRHTAAYVSCQACHGERAFTEPVAMQVCTDCH